MDQLTLRDLFAMAALCGLLVDQDNFTSEQCVRESWRIADLMMAQKASSEDS